MCKLTFKNCSLLADAQFALTLSLLGLLAIVTNSSGCLRPDGSNDADYLAYGSQYQTNLLILVAQYPGGTDWAAVTRIDKWNFVTAEHNLHALRLHNPTNYFIAIGTNVSSNWVATVPVANIKDYPGYITGSYEAPDIAEGTTAQPIPTAGTNPDANIVLPQFGAVANCAGFGYAGTPSGGTFLLDGNSRAWNADIVSGVPNNVSREYYFETAFWPNTVALNGKALSGDSGGPTYDGSGNLIGIHIAQVGDNEQTGNTVDLILAQTDVLNFIALNSFSPQSLKIQQRGENMVLTWTGSGILQSTANLNGTFSDIQNAAGAYTNAIGSSAQMFFKLRPN